MTNEINNFVKIIDGLPKQVNLLQAEVDVLKNKNIEQDELDSRVWKRNNVGKWSIKVVYPNILADEHRIDPVAGFPKYKESLARQMEIGNFFFIYCTSPIKKIIAMGEVTGHMKTVESRWPFIVPFKWIIKPKPGITWEEVNLEVRVRIGDTIFSINEEIALNIKKRLEKQPDLTEEEIQGILSLL